MSISPIVFSPVRTAAKPQPQRRIAFQGHNFTPQSTPPPSTLLARTALRFGREINPDLIQTLNRALGDMTPAQRIQHVAELFGLENIAITSSGGADSAVLLSYIAEALPNEQPTITFLDTGYHFAQTEQHIRTLAKLFGFNLNTIRATDDEKAQLEQKHGDPPYKAARQDCCQVNKVKPLQNFLAGKKVWMTGARRDQTEARARMDFVSFNEQRGILIARPILDITADQIEALKTERKLPEHQLVQMGYNSIGCYPPMCTQPGQGRTGRWAGEAGGKSECGIQTLI